MAPHAEVDVFRSASSTASSKAGATPVLSKMQSSTSPNPPCVMLKTSGTNIVKPDGSPIILKGAGLGGHLNMENFITGYPGHEHEHRAALAEVLGAEKAQFFFDRLIHHFFTEADAEFFASLGLNCIRIPFNYRHFIDDQNPDEFKRSGFELLDRQVQICAKYNLYVILDLHSAPGGQNQDWHSDTGLAKAMFWEHRIFQDQALRLWQAIASHYAGNPVIAGYNPLNEPADPKHHRLISWYERAEKAIREVDPDHILFIDGNTYAMDFTQFTSVLPNSVYACHDYAMLGFPIPGQAPYSGTEEQNSKLLSQFDRKVTFMRQHNVPIWNGEFGPVYADPTTDKDADNTNQARYNVLKQQLSIYKSFSQSVSWSIWLYKDLGYQGMLHLDPQSKYMQLIRPFLAKKQAIGLDFWGCTSKQEIDQGTYTPFIEQLKKTVPEHLQNRKYPNVWRFERQVERVVRECLMSEYAGYEFAELFQGMDYEELEELASCWNFDNCVRRGGLNDILRKDAQVGSSTL